MRSTLGYRDRLLLWLFVPALLLCVGLSVASIPRAGNVPFYVDRSAVDAERVDQEFDSPRDGDFLRVRSFFSGGEERLPLRPGDRLLSVEGETLAGASPAALRRTLLLRHAALGRPLAVEIGRGPDVLKVRLDLGVGPEYSALLLIAIVYALAAIVLILRAPESPSARALFRAFAVTPFVYGAYFSVLFPWGSAAVTAIAHGVYWPLLTLAFLQFPDERAAPGRQPWWPWLLSFFGVLSFASDTGLLIDAELAGTVFELGSLLWIAGLVVIISRNYRACGALGRRQLKWVVFGVYAGALTFSFAVLVQDANPASPTLMWTLLIVASSIHFPLTIAISILRFDLFDIDRLIGATAASNVLAVVLIGGGLLIVPRVADLLSSTLSVALAVGQVGLSMGLAAVSVPCYRRFRPAVDRLFFPERSAVLEGMGRLLAELSASRTPGDLWQRTGEELDEMLQASTTAIYARAGESFVPVFVRGRGVVPAVQADGDLARVLTHARGALLVNQALMSRIGMIGKATLGSLDARALVPIRRHDSLEAFVALGEKRSGDILTSTDLTLLSTLADSLSIHLLRFQEEELLERARAMQGTLRRYVPGVVADQIAAGGELESSEREVTVLFVDIRGYTAFSDGRDASDIFSTINEYTGAVSRTVVKHGGAIVEFNGDGMMVVFGAPRALPDKEACGVRAALELVEEIPKLSTGEDRLMVGVGVATGMAFVGNIRAVDRDIWSAIGNTTNLAARLQSLTRDLDASVVLDEPTWHGASEEAASFTRRERVEIRGRRKRELIFTYSGGPSRS